jgi:hypothetical protein
MTRCFVAMPITTPKPYADQLDDTEHFLHVLNSLFEPALVKAGYEAVPPISSGSELIHASIIKNLEECELVLCDISALNPNVFFELGIRTALNKPVVIVRDSLTRAIPFDTASINTHTYDVSLRAWLIESEVDKLATHITVTAAKSEGQNPLWRFFGIQQTAQPAQIENPTEAKLDLLIAEISDLKRASERSPSTTVTSYYPGTYTLPVNTVSTNAQTVYSNYAGSLWAQTPPYDPDLIPISSAPQPVQNFGSQARAIASREGANLEVEGYNTKTRKLIMNSRNWPLSGRTIVEINEAGLKLGVEFELRSQ